MHHNQRGLPKRRYKVWTIIHNFDCRAVDGTTPASRFFRQTFPDLFETVLSQGIRVRRDSWVSVMYAEGLNSDESSVTFQRTDRHGILGQKPTDFQVSL